jgi:SAM-dependent methyltransferase
MATTKFHFLNDYRALVRSLMQQFPLDEAMSRAVGGSYEAVGEVEKQLLIQAGLKRDHVLVDVGCGSGRLAKALAPYLGTTGQVLGTDVVLELLKYAAKDCPAHWRFALVEDIRIPYPDDCADFACFFSVFTHLLHEETYHYLTEARRVVRPGGRIVFSFLELPYNWEIFEMTWKNVAAGHGNVHLNVFFSRDMIECWAEKLGLRIVEFHHAHDDYISLSKPVRYDDGRIAEGRAALGQSLCILENTKPGEPRRASGPVVPNWSNA